jgi:adenosylmethionine-8-amino-7-oxononanoate aminotransferase
MVARNTASPPPDEPTWLTRGAPHVWRPYCQHASAPAPIPIVGCHGSRLVLDGGREIVDGLASWWTAAHGYRHPHIIAAVEAQLRCLPHVAFGGLAHEAAYTLATRLTRLLPGTLTRAFFVESGSVAVEVAIKMAVQSFHNRGERTRRRVLCFEGAYHGDTFATMSLCDPVAGMHAAFAGAGGLATVHMPLPAPRDDRFETAFARVADTLACAVVEPLVQCAGGFRFHDADALRRLRRACDAHGVLLVLDEIATGFHRTGRRFALDAAEIIPDIVVLGKALTGGTLPLAVTVASEQVFSAFLGDNAEQALQHGPTYMGNALACAAALASLDLFEREDTEVRVRNLEAALKRGLSPLMGAPHVRDVRVMGAIGVVEMLPGSAPVSSAFAERHAFLRPLRHKHADFVYLMPPLSINDEDLAVLLSAVEGLLEGRTNDA